MVDCSTYASCQFCDEKPDGLGEAYKHFRDHWRSENFEYQCDDCGIAFLSPVHLKNHEAEKKVNRKLICPAKECYGFFNSKNCFQFHTYYSHGMCRMCLKVCKSGEQLSEHMKKHQKHVRSCAGCKKKYQFVFMGFRRTGGGEKYCKDCYPIHMGCAFEDSYPTCEICNWTMHENSSGNAKLTHYQRFHPWYFSNSNFGLSNLDIFKKSNEVCPRDEPGYGSDSDSDHSLKLKVKLPFMNIKSPKLKVETVVDNHPLKIEPETSRACKVDDIGSIRSVLDRIEDSGLNAVKNANEPNADKPEAQNNPGLQEADSDELHLTFGDLAEKTEQNSPDIDEILEVLQKDERLLNKVECVLNKSERIEERLDQLINLTESPVKTLGQKHVERADSMTESVVSEVSDQTDDDQSPICAKQNEVQSGFVGEDLINMASETLKDTSQLLDCLNSNPRPVKATSPTCAVFSSRKWNPQNKGNIKLRQQFRTDNSQSSPSASPAHQQLKTMTRLFREFRKQKSTKNSSVQQPVTSPILGNKLYTLPSPIVSGIILGNDPKKRLKLILPKSVQNTDQVAPSSSTSPAGSPYKPILPRPFSGASRLYPLVGTNPSLDQQRILQVGGPSSTFRTAPSISLQTLQNVANSTLVHVNQSNTSPSGGVCFNLREKPKTYTVNCNIQKTVSEGGKELKIKFDISPKNDSVNETNRKHYTVDYSADGEFGGCSKDLGKRTDSRSGGAAAADNDDDDLIYEGVSHEKASEDVDSVLPETADGFRSPRTTTKSGLQKMIVETNTSVTTGPAGVPNLRKRPSEGDSSICSKSARLVTMPGNDTGVDGFSSRKPVVIPDSSNSSDPNRRNQKTLMIRNSEVSKESGYGNFHFVLCNEDISNLSEKKIELLHHLNIFRQFLWSERPKNLRPFYKSSDQFYETLNLPNDVQEHSDFSDDDSEKCFSCNKSFSSVDNLVGHILSECQQMDETIEVDRWMLE